MGLFTKNTSYDSKGAVEPTPDAFDEQGSSFGPKIFEIVPDLRTRAQEYRTYHMMSLYDAATRSSLRAVKSVLLGAEFYVEPANSDQESVDQAEFVTDNIFENTTATWTQTADKICGFLPYGCSIFETVFERRDWAPDRPNANHKTYTMLKKLAPRPIRTIQKINYDDNGGPKSIIQTAIRADNSADDVEISVNDLVFFSFDDDDGQLWGKSILRSAYPHWYYKTHLYKIDAIQKERHSLGVPRAKPPANASPQDKKIAREMLGNLRANEKAFVLQPFGWEFDFMKIEGTMVDVIKSIDHHNGMIMLNVLAEFLMLGMMESGGGGRSTSASQQDIFMKSNRYLADLLLDVFNKYLIPKIIGYNFETEDYPKLCARNLGETRDQQQWATAMANLVDKEIIVPDEGLESWARAIMQAPTRKEARPELSPAQIRELIQVKEDKTTQNGVTGATGPGDSSNASTVKNPKGGNLGKGNNVY